VFATIHMNNLARDIGEAGQDTSHAVRLCFPAPIVQVGKMIFPFNGSLI
jgi:hypothetical protein